MIVEYVRYQIPAERRDAFEEAYTTAQSALAASPHCLAWELSRCSEDPAQYTLRIEWDSAEGHLDGFRKSAEFGPFLQAIRPFIGNIREMRHYAVTSVASRKS